MKDYDAFFNYTVDQAAKIMAATKCDPDQAAHAAVDDATAGLDMPDTADYIDHFGGDLATDRAVEAALRARL